MAGFFDGLNFKDMLTTGVGAYGEYEKSQQARAEADRAQMEYQASQNMVSLAKSNYVKLAIGGAVAVIVAFFIFKK